MSVLDRMLGRENRALTPAIERLDLTNRGMTSDGIRDPSAATQQINYQSPGTIQVPEWDADTAVREAYLSSVIVFACIRTRAYAFSGCPLRAVLPGAAGKAGLGKGIENHDPNAPLAKLLGPAPGSPNPQFSSRKMWAYAMAMKITTGFFAWELEKPVGATGKDWQPVRAWPLVNRVFRPVPTGGGLDLFEKFKYGRAQDMRTLTPDQVFYVYDPSPNDIRQPASVLQAARYDITADVLQSIYDVAFLRNDARPAGVLVHEAFEESDQRRAFRQQFDAAHRGPQNANRIAFAEPGGDGTTLAGGAIQWINMGISQKDAQMLATHNEKAMRICIVLSVPMSLLDASGRTFNNAGMEERNFWNDTMIPDLRDMEDEINMKIAPRLGPHVAVFDTSHVQSLQPPMRFLSTKIEDLVDRKIITPAEARQELDYPDDMHGEVLATGSTLLDTATIVDKLVAAGWSPQEAAAVVGLTPPAAKEVPDPKVQTFPVLPGGVPASALPAMTPTPTGQNDAHALTVVRSAVRRSGERKRIWQQQYAHIGALEAAWAKGMRRLFARQAETTLKRLESRRSRWEKALETRDAGDDYTDWTGEVFDPTYWQVETEAAVTGLYESLYAAGGAQVAGMFGLTYNINDPRVEEQITRRASQLASQVTGTTFDAIQVVIRTGIREGTGIPGISAGIEEVFAQADSTRATMIARTEVIRSSADGAMSAWDQAVREGLIDPQQYGKVWVTAEDDRTCVTCEGLDGETVAFGETFSNAEEGPPDHPSCRCTVGVESLTTATRGKLEPEHVAAVLQAISEGRITASDLVA